MNGAGDALRKHFRTPRNTGEVQEPHGRGRAENPPCGDVLEITLRLANGRVEQLRFRARACSAVIATASLVTEKALGLALADALRLDPTQLVREAGGLPAGRSHAPAVVARALRAALEEARGASGAQGT